MIGFALGNGKSRAEIDIDVLKNIGKVYGCNAIYRDATPDILISTDPPISKEIQDSGYPKNNVHYTRQPFNGSGSLQIDEICRGWSSGPIAVRYACKECSKIFLLGFDLSSNDNFINNVYAGSYAYKSSNSPPTYYGNWVGQINRVLEEFTNVKFTRIVTNYTASPKEWARFKNYNEMDLHIFKTWLNKH